MKKALASRRDPNFGANGQFEASDEKRMPLLSCHIVIQLGKHTYHSMAIAFRSFWFGELAQCFPCYVFWIICKQRASARADRVPSDRGKNKLLRLSTGKDTLFVIKVKRWERGLSTRTGCTALYVFATLLARWKHLPSVMVVHYLLNVWRYVWSQVRSFASMLTNVGSVFSWRTCQCCVMHCFLVVYFLRAHLYFYSRQHSDGIVHLFKHFIIEDRFISVFLPQIQIYGAFERSSTLPYLQQTPSHIKTGTHFTLLHCMALQTFRGCHSHNGSRYIHHYDCMILHV
jgi:hypothetical protein